MNQIKVELHRHDNFVCGRVLEMPEELRRKGSIICKSQYGLRSTGYPAIDSGNQLMLRGGADTRDNDWFYYVYRTAVEAAEAEKAFLNLIDEWNEQHRDILDDVEREYLSAVLKPFKKEVKYVVKFDDGKSKWIYVKITDNDILSFPYFENENMYAGMKEGKKYTAEELGLFEEG